MSVYANIHADSWNRLERDLGNTSSYTLSTSSTTKTFVVPVDVKDLDHTTWDFQIDLYKTGTTTRVARLSMGADLQLNNVGVELSTEDLLLQWEDMDGNQLSELTFGDEVQLAIYTGGMVGTNIALEIYEDDGIDGYHPVIDVLTPDDLLDDTLLVTIGSDGIGRTSWRVVWQNDAFGAPEYFFRAPAYDIDSQTIVVADIPADVVSILVHSRFFIYPPWQIIEGGAIPLILGYVKSGWDLTYPDLDFAEVQIGADQVNVDLYSAPIGGVNLGGVDADNNRDFTGPGVQEYIELGHEPWWYTLGYIQPQDYAGHLDSDGNLPITVNFNVSWEDDLWLDTQQSCSVAIIPDLPSWDTWYAGDVHFHSDLTNSMNWDSFSLIGPFFGEYGTPLAITSIVGEVVGLDWITVTDHSYELDGSNDDSNGPEPDYWRDLYDYSDAALQSISNDDFKWENLENSPAFDDSFLFLKGEEVSVDADSRDLDPTEEFLDWLSGINAFNFIDEISNASEGILDVWDSLAKQQHMLVYRFDDGDEVVTGPGYDIPDSQDMRDLGEATDGTTGDIMDDVVNQELFAYAAHPMLENDFFGQPWGNPDIDNISVVTQALGFVDSYGQPVFRGFEFWNGQGDSGRDSSLSLWEDVLAYLMDPSDDSGQLYNWYLSGGSDEHMDTLPLLGGGGHVNGDGNVGDVRTVVCAPSLSDPNVLDALYYGRSFVTDGPWFAMGVDRGDTVGSFMDFGIDTMMGEQLVAQSPDDGILLFDWPNQTNTIWGQFLGRDLSLADIKLIHYGADGVRDPNDGSDFYTVANASEYFNLSGKTFNAYELWSSSSQGSPDGWQCYRVELWIDMNRDGVDNQGDYKVYTNPIWINFDLLETEAPQAQLLTADDITSGGGATQTITVRYTDNVAVEYSSLDGSDIRVTGNGYDQLATFISSSPSSDNATIDATYQITAPGGTWDIGDNGTYTVYVQPNEVSDTASLPNYVASVPLGTFQVDIIPDTTPPTVVDLNAPNITSGGDTTYEFTVTYEDNVAIRIETIDHMDIRVVDPHGFEVMAEFVRIEPHVLIVPEPIPATYRIPAPGGTWDYADNGTYTVYMQLDQVSDTAIPPNYVAAGVLDVFEVDITDTIAPTANLSHPEDGASILPGVINGSERYIDVTFTDTGGSGLDISTIVDPGQEFTLGGTAASGVTLDGTPALQSGTTYRYTFTGDFGHGPVDVNFLPDSWADNAWNTNVAEIESFLVRLPILYVDDDSPGDPGPGDPAVSDPQEDGTADHPFDEIQEAIDVAIDGDTVIVAEGTYYENIDFTGKDIVVRSEDAPSTTIIDGSQTSNVVRFTGGESRAAVLDSFTLTNGRAPYHHTGYSGGEHGGGILIDDSSPTIRNCIIRDNQADYAGGGMMIGNSSAPLIENTIFLYNIATGYSSGAVYTDGPACAPIFNNCLFVGNESIGKAGVMQANGGALITVLNSTMSDNTAAYGPAAIYTYGSFEGFAQVQMTNTIVFNNQSSDPMQLQGDIIATYSLIGDSWPGIGNVETDPHFVDSSAGDYHLMQDSPCIDAGDNSAVPVEITTDLDGKSRFIDDTLTPDTGIGTPPIVDMGAYEFAALYVDADSPSDPGTGTPDDPFKSIQGAMDAAQEGYFVLVRGGIYNESITVQDGIYLYGGYDSGDWTAPREPDINETIIDATGLLDSVIHIIDSDVTIDGFTITNGLADAGGGVYCENSNVTISNCVIRDNRTADGEDPWGHAGNGGGIYLTSSIMTIANTTITGNITGTVGTIYWANGGSGAGLYSDSSLLTITDSVVSYNVTGIGSGSEGGDGGDGAGIYCTSTSTLTVENCFINDNVTGRGSFAISWGGKGGDGAGVYCSVATIIDSEINNNRTGNSGDCEYDSTQSGGHGGGIYGASGAIDIIGCTISGNTTGSGGTADFEGGDGGDGAGIYCTSASTLTVENCLINDNIAGSGGSNRGSMHGCGGDGGDGAGIFCSVATIINSTISNNRTGNGGNGGNVDYSRAGNGGGIYVASGAIDIIECTISGNTTGSGGNAAYIYGYGGDDGGDGAGIYSTSSATLNIVSCAITNNTTGNGGSASPFDSGHGGDGGDGAGIFCFSGTVTNCTIANNTTGSGGNGGLYPDGGHGGDGGDGAGIFCSSGTVTNCTIANNTTGAGGNGSIGEYDGLPGQGPGIYADSNTLINNTIIWGNSPEQLVGHDSTNVSYCNIEDSVLAGTNGNIDVDPRFVDPSAGDYHLLPSSLCVDSGDNAVVTVTTDLDGNPRIINGTVDMGAYEYQGPRSFYVDDDAPGDPGPGDPSIPDPLEDGTQAHPFDSIQEAIDVAIDGVTVIVEAGTYTENLTIDKSVTLEGAQAGVAVASRTAADASESTVSGMHTITGSTINIDGFTLSDPALGSGNVLVSLDSSGGTIDGVTLKNNFVELGSGDVGIDLGGYSLSNQEITNVTIEDSVFNGPGDQISNPMRIGNWFDNPEYDVAVDGVTFQRNTVEKGSIPIQLQDENLANITITQNTFTNTDGTVYVWGNSGSTPSGVLSNFEYSKNSIDNTNSYGVGIDVSNVFGDGNYGGTIQITENSFDLDDVPTKYGFDSVSILSSGFTNTIDASGNWYGTNTASGVAAEVSASVDYTPWLHSGDDQSSDPGFQGDFSHLHVDDDSPQAGSAGRIQEAIDLLTAGPSSAIKAVAGTYPESVIVDKELSVIGVGDTTIIQPALDADGITITADNVLIQDLKVSTTNSGVSPNIAISIQETDNVEINNNTIETTGDKAMGIWVGGSSNGMDPSTNLDILGNTITINNAATGIYAAPSNPAHSGWVIGGSPENGNTITANNGNPVELYDVSSSEVSYNTLTTSASGGSNVIWSSELSDIANLVFKYNTVDYSGGSQVAFLTDFLSFIGEVIDSTNTTISTVTISRNEFSNWGARALRIGDGAGVDGTTVTGVVVNSNTFQMTADTIEVIGGTAAGNPTGTGNTFNVNTPAKIQKAIDSAFSGDAINVAAGTYTEDLTITTDGLELAGASDANPTQTVIKGVANVASGLFPLAAPNIEILGDDVKIHGFTIEGPNPVGGKFSSGIVIGGLDVEIYNNKFLVPNASTWNDISQGIQTYHGIVNPAGTDLTGLNIHDNDFYALGDGTAGYEAIYINRTTTDPTPTGAVTIADNTFNDELFRGVTTERSNVTISGNTFNTTLLADDGADIGEAWQAILVRDYSGNQQDVTISNNTIQGVGVGGEGFAQGIRIGRAGQTLTNITVEQNTVTDSTIGVQVRDSADGVVVNNNDISGNTTGVDNMDAVNTLDASGNWWGHASGPDGTGDPVSSNVDYSPWWGGNYVGDNHSSAWTWWTNDSIQDAFDLALAGDTINIIQGVYTEDLTIEEQFASVNFIGNGSVASEIDGTVDLVNANLYLYMQNNGALTLSDATPANPPDNGVIDTGADSSLLIDTGDGTLSLNADVTANSGITLDGGIINVGNDAGDKITSDGAVSITGTDTVTINAVIDPSTVNITSNSNLIINNAVTADDLITATAGLVSGVGNVNLNVGGNLTTTAAGSDIQITAGGTTGDISLAGNVTAVDQVTITALGGSINETGAGDSAVDITADALTLTAQDEIGGAGELDIETTVASLDASSTTTGDIVITETDAITLTDVDTVDGDITIVAGGAITATDVQTTDGAINLTAGGALIATLVTSADAGADEEHDVTLATTIGGMVLTSVTADDDITATADAGNIELGNLTAKDSISLEATLGQMTHPTGTIEANGSSIIMKQKEALDLKNLTFNNQGNTDITLQSYNGSITAVDTTNGGKDDNAADQWNSITATAENNILLLGTGDIKIGGDLTSNSGGVSVISHDGGIYDSDSYDYIMMLGTTLDKVALSGYSDDAAGAGVDLPSGPGKAAIVIMSADTLNLGPVAVLTANGTYDSTGTVDDRAGIGFLDVPATIGEVLRDEGDPFDAAICLGSFGTVSGDEEGDVTVHSTVSMAANGTMVIDAYDTVNAFGSNFTGSAPWSDMTNSLEVTSRITEWLFQAVGRLPYPYGDGPFPSGYTYVLRGAGLSNPAITEGRAWVLVDLTAPIVTVDNLMTNDTTPELTGTVDDSDAVVEVTVDGNSYAAVNNGDGTWALANDTIGPLADGTYDVLVSATDLAGNTGTDSTTGELIVDTTPTVVTVDTLLTNDSTPELTGTVDDPNATIEVTVDGNTYTAMNSYYVGEITEVSQGQSSGDAFDIGPVSGTYSVDAFGKLILGPYDSGYISPDGSVIISTTVPGDIPYEEAGISVGVKQGSGMGVDSLSGTYNIVLFNGNNATVFSCGIGYLNFDAAGSYTAEITEVAHGQSQGEALGVESIYGGYSVSADGRLVIHDSSGYDFTGYISSDASLVVWSTVPGNVSAEETGIAVAVKQGTGFGIDSLDGTYNIVAFNSDDATEFSSGIACAQFNGFGSYIGEVLEVSDGQSTGSALGNGPFSGTYSVDQNGKFHIDPYDDTGFISADASLIVWTHVPGDVHYETGIYIGVRQGSGLGAESLDGTYNTVLFSSDHATEFTSGIGYLSFNAGGTWTLPDNIISPALSDGVYDIKVSATDLAGNVGTDATIDELTIDTIAPVVQDWTLSEDTGINSTDKLTKDTTPELTFTFSEIVFGEDSDVVVLDPNSSPVIPDSITGWGSDTLVIMFSTPLVLDGEYTVTLNGTGTIEDEAGNPLNGGIDEVVHFTIDTTSSVVTVDTLWTNDPTPELTGTVDDPDAAIEVTVDGNSHAAVNNGDGTWTLPDDTISPELADDTYDVAVAATDLAGNVGTDATTDELTIEVGNFQIVYGTDGFGPAGGPVSLPVFYTTSDNNTTLTGIGVRLHYNSSELALDSFSDVYANGLLAQGTPEADIDDFDQDPTTDTFVNIAWVEIAGQWPNEPLPIDLYTANFTISDSLSEGSTSTIRFSASSTAAGYSLQSTPVTVTVRNYNWDIDDNGAYDALTDGLLTIRYLFDFRGDTLIEGAVAPDANRSTAEEIEVFLAAASVEGMLDIDGNGIPDALTDGILVMRYLFDFRGDTLIDGAVAPGAPRDTAAEIEDFIESYMPPLVSTTPAGNDPKVSINLQEAGVSPNNLLEETNSNGSTQVITPDPLTQKILPGDPVSITMTYSTADTFKYTVSNGNDRIDTTAVKMTITGTNNLAIESCRVRRARRSGSDSIRMPSMFDVPVDSIFSADEIQVKISAYDGSEVYSGLISVDPADISKGVYNYRTRSWKGWPGGIILLKLNTNGQTFTSRAKDIDLAILNYPLTLEITVVDYIGSDQMD